MADERDFAIISQLRRNPFLSYESIGRGIGLSGNATKMRIEALERAEILTSLRAMPAAQIFHRVPRLFFFGPATAEKVDKALEKDPSVFATMDVNGRAAVLRYVNLASSGPPEDLKSLLGPVETEENPLLPYPHRELASPISVPQLVVLRVLVDDLRTSVKEISKATGLSQKVVKRVRREMLEKGLFQVQPIFQSARSSRIVMYELHVRSEDDSVLLDVKQTLPRSIFINQWESSATIFSCWAESIDDVFETQRRVRSRPGVSDVSVRFHARATLNTARLTSLIDEEVRRISPRTRSSVA
ncbi:MAG TPA: winged helix-turn-helix transcriptional regulator [Nitrososphaerales archaeon]|nr:winged helix-turn-helix transcriptional regulator [Nitrososphaerales archaeon]